jgi:HlyD family secretion protein
LREVFRLSDGRVPSRSELEVAEGNVARGRASVASAQANVASAEASLRTSQTGRDRATIRSPVAGVVLARQVEPGQTVAASFNTPTLFVLAEDLSVMQLRVDLDEADVGNVEPGQQANFTVDAYPGRRFPARVERVDLAANNIAAAAETAQPNQVVSYEARLTVANGEGLLRPGMTATATIATASTGVAMLVPNTALRFDPDEQEEEEASFVNNGDNFGLEEEEDRATIGVGSRQRVHVLGADGKLQEIQVVTSNDLKPGMKVVTGIRVVAP